MFSAIRKFFRGSHTCTAFEDEQGVLYWKCCMCSATNGASLDWEFLCRSCGHDFQLCLIAARINRLKL